MPLGALKNSFAGRALGAGLAGMVALTPMAAIADDAKPTEAAVWTDELRGLDAARDAATAHATTHGAAIILHVGMDIQNHPQRDALLEWVAETYKGHFKPHGIEIEVFTSLNDAPASGLEYRIGPKPYTPKGQPDPLLDLATAEDPAVVEDVATQTALQLELALNTQDDFTVTPGG